MKTTKLLIGAMAVMSFAACQNDALVAEQPSVEGRKQIDVKIVPTESVDSRMINNNGSFSWETTDKLGAALVDVNGVIANGSHFGNAQFNYADGQFTTASTMSVGSYVFYYPYDKKNTTTKAGVIVKTLGAQKFDATGEEMMKNNFMVAPVTNLEGAEAGELTLPMTFRSIYGYGNLTLTNNLDEEGEIEILKIIIENGSDKFAIGGKLNVELVEGGDLDDNTPHNQNNLYVELEEDTDAAAAYAKADSVYLNWINEEGETVKPAPVQWIAAADVEKGAVSIDCLTGTTGVKVAHGASVSTRVLIPAGEYTKANWTIKVYTSKGVATINSNNITTTEEEGQEDKIVVRNSRTKTIAAELTGGVEDATSVDAISKEDFIASMAQFKGGDVTTLTVNVAAGVEVDAEMLAAVPSVIENLTFGSDVTINATTTLKKVSFASGKAVTLKGNVTIQPASTITMFNGNEVTVEGTVKVASNVVADFIVKKDATLNLNAGVSVTNVTSNGTLNIGSANGSAVTADVTAETGAVTVNSELNGTLTLGSSADNAKALTATINNHATTVSVLANATVTANVEPKEDGTVLTIASNVGTIVNNKALEVVDNNGKITNAADAELTVGTNSALVENYGKATVESNEGTDEENIATINQYAGADLLVTGNSNEYSEVNTAADSETVVTENEGEVVYVEGARIAVNGGDGNVAYAMEAPTDEDITKLAKAKPYINKLVITSADYTLAKALEIPTSITSIVFEGNATFSEAISTKLTATIPENKAAGANDYYERINPIALTFKGDVKFVKGATFIEGAVLTFNGGNTLDGSTITVGKKPTKNTNTTGDATKDNGAYGIKAPLTLNIDNGYMTNKVEFVAHTSALTINFGVKNETKGIAAGSIWNDMIFSSVANANYTEGGVTASVENRLWKGTAITTLSYQ